MRQRLAANPALLLLGIIAIVALIAACILGFFLLRTFLQDRDTTTAGEPTPFATAVTTVASAPAQPAIVGVSDSGTFSVTLDIPSAIELGGQLRTVQPQNINVDGLWSPEIASEDGSAWINGSIVNYVFGLPDNERNRALLESLEPGDEIVVTTRQGVTHTFAFDSRAEVSNSDRNVFSQQTPGITLLLLGSDSDNRLVVRGRYEVAAAAAGATSNVVQLGETAQLGDLQVAPQATSFLTNRPEAPAGFGFYLIDFTLQNVGLTALDTSAYRFTLSDELGNQYALNPIATRLGNNPPVGGFVNAGQSVPASAGYQIPAGLVSPTLTWTVTGPDGAQIQAVLPFTAGGAAGQNAVVSLQSAAITTDMTSLAILGQITNVGSQPLVITRDDVSLRSAAGTDFILLSTNPPFPWTIPPNQTLQFGVDYPRPIAATSAVFTVLDQPFELSGLQP